MGVRIVYLELLDERCGKKKILLAKRCRRASVYFWSILYGTVFAKWGVCSGRADISRWEYILRGGLDLGCLSPTSGHQHEKWRA